MSHQHPPQTLTFNWLQYPLSQVQYWLSKTDLDCFIFDFYLPDTQDPSRPIHLCCFTHNKQPGFYNPSNPDILTPYKGNALVMSGPLQLTPNQVTAAQMSSLIASADGSENNYLLFIPTPFGTEQISYTVKFFKRTITGDVFGEGSTTTNPSPPATAM